MGITTEKELKVMADDISTSYTDRLINDTVGESKLFVASKID